MSDKLTWANVALKLISFLQAVLPAFLIAYSERLKARMRGLKVQLAKKNRELGDAQDKAYIEDKYDDKDASDIIDDFLDSPSPDDADGPGEGDGGDG